MQTETHEAAVHTTALIQPAELRLKPTATPKLEHVDLASALAKTWKIHANTQVPMKTFGPDTGEIHYVDGSGQIAKLENVMVTLMRLTNPNTGAVSLQMSLEYLATSTGSRTPDGRALPGATSGYNPGREDYMVPHYVYFRNSAGGLVYGWYVGHDFELGCGWNKRHCLHGRAETTVLDWFDAVSQYQWAVNGPFYRC